jgi:hypothetical protein
LLSDEYNNSSLDSLNIKGNFMHYLTLGSKFKIV